MVNKVVLDYLKKNSGKFEIPVLKKKLLSAGYTQKDVNEAESSFLSSKNAPNIAPALSRVEEAQIEEKNLVKNSKWFRIAGIFGILAITFLVLLAFFSDLRSIVGLGLTLGIVFSLILFLSGFILLGRRHDGMLLGVASWILIGFVVIFLIFQTIGFFSPTFMRDLFIGDVSPNGLEDIVGSILEVMIGVLIFAVIILLSLVALGIIFGIGVMKLGDKVPFAKVTGILNIIGWSTLIIGVGVLVLIVAYVFEIILLFKVGKSSLRFA
ncbi:hypothetical protein HOA55_00045 [archaeon]|jgi:hypothetical protein|nr:hypothetical protein [archaeon]MBT3577905.1 hypothetical protein [archaeon]MBT6819731.1 hypothetical protein [archaeon]MBT6956015.1 hypothetical protein [archaeon]MBT7025514.1 hypothetical protein [archaeon]